MFKQLVKRAVMVQQAKAAAQAFSRFPVLVPTARVQPISLYSRVQGVTQMQVRMFG